MTAYRRDFYETKYMSFFIKDDKLFEKYNEICKKVNNNIKGQFDSEPLYNEKCKKAKLQFHNEQINTNFHNDKISKEGSQFICLSVILINFVFRTANN